MAVRHSVGNEKVVVHLSKVVSRISTGVQGLNVQASLLPPLPPREPRQPRHLQENVSSRGPRAADRLSVKALVSVGPSAATVKAAVRRSEGIGREVARHFVGIAKVAVRLSEAIGLEAIPDLGVNSRPGRDLRELRKAFREHRFQVKAHQLPHGPLFIKAPRIVDRSATTVRGDVRHSAAIAKAVALQSREGAKVAVRLFEATGPEATRVPVVNIRARVVNSHPLPALWAARKALRPPPNVLLSERVRVTGPSSVGTGPMAVLSFAGTVPVDDRVPGRNVRVRRNRPLRASSSRLPVWRP